MDKILRRVRQAEANVARRIKRRETVQTRSDLRDRLQERRRVYSEVRDQRKDAIKARKEDWQLGPLAPRRDVNVADKHGNMWGSVSPSRAMLELSITDKEREERCAWAGGATYLCLAKTDRVVVIEGHHKGKIGTITKVDKEKGTVEMANDITVNATVPEFLLDDGQDKVQLVAAQLPISAVRLIHPVQDPATGVIRDAIIRELKPYRLFHDKLTKKYHYKRVVPGENIIIPWPKNEPTKHEDYASDTLRIDVDERTFVPTLLRPPMPEAVINELRNPYSRFRTRHMDEYVAKIQAIEDEKKARVKAAKTMLTPVQEYNRKLREKRRALGQPELTEEMLAKIGEVIETKLEARKAAPKVEPVPADVRPSKGKNALKKEKRAKAAAEATEKLTAAVEQLTVADATTTPETTTTGGEQPKTE